MWSSMLLLLTLCGLFWTLLKFLRLWSVQGTLNRLPGPPNPSFIYGNIRQLFDRNGWEFHRELGEKYGPAVRLHGEFGSRFLYVFDPKAMHNIAIKEHHIYEESDFFLKTNNATMGPGIASVSDEQHRRQRRMLHPAFGNNHLREMIPTLYDVAFRLRLGLERCIQSKGTEIDMANWMCRTTLEVIGQSGLGYSFDPLTEERQDAYRTALTSYTPTLYSLSGYFQIFTCLGRIMPSAMMRCAAPYLPHRGFQKLREIVNTMHGKAVEIYQAKMLALESGDESAKEQLGYGKDIMSILLRANLLAQAKDRLSEEELIGQMSTLIFAAMDTSSSVLSMLLYLLAQHPDAQSRLREEILMAKGAHERLSYDDLMSLPYLDAVYRETVRLHPPAVLRFRETREDVVLPLSEPILGRDGNLITEIPLPKNTTVLVSPLSSNTNKAVWGDDAYDWKPERWLEPLPETVKNAKIPGVYSKLMTFWGGGRGCIGYNFAQVEIKVVLAVLLSSFTFELTEKPIRWNIAGVMYPTVGFEVEPSLPLRVGLVGKV